MHRFRLRKIHYLSYIFTITISLVGIYIFNDYFANIIFLLCISASLIGAVNSYFTTINLNKEIVVKKSLIKTTSILLNEIDNIQRMPTSRGKKNFIGIYGAGKKIFITFWYSNYKDLVALLINNCKVKDKIEIDPRILEIINEK